MLAHPLMVVGESHVLYRKKLLSGIDMRSKGGHGPSRGMLGNFSLHGGGLKRHGMGTDSDGREGKTVPTKIVNMKSGQRCLLSVGLSRNP